MWPSVSEDGNVLLQCQRVGQRILCTFRTLLKINNTAGACIQILIIIASFVILNQNHSNNHKTQARPFKNKDEKEEKNKNQNKKPQNPTSLSLISVTFQHY